MHKKTATVIRKILHFFEGAIAILTLFVLVGMLVAEVYRMFTVDGYFDSINTYLHNILTLVVGLEFVRMLLDMTPANTLEVLIVAIARQVILTHDNPWSNVASVLCIAGLFAVRRFLIPKGEMTMELSEMGEEEVLEIAADRAPEEEHISSR